MAGLPGYFAMGALCEGQPSLSCSLGDEEFRHNMRGGHFTKTIALFGCPGAALGIVMSAPLWTEEWWPTWAWCPFFKQIGAASWYVVLHLPASAIVWLWSIGPVPFFSRHGADVEPMMNAWIIAIVIQWTVIGLLAGAIAGALTNRTSAVPNPQGGANGGQPFTSDPNGASAAAASRRSP
jgi:hypothetical protein